MENRIVRLEDDLWLIRTDTGELSNTEQKELEEFLNKVKLPYHLVDERLCVAGVVGRDTLFERLEHFYEGRAVVLPF